MVFDSKRPPSAADEERFPFCVVDRFLSSITHLALVSAAFEVSLVDTLEREGPCPRRELRARLGLDRRTYGLLIEGLAGIGVLDEQQDDLALSRRFREALGYRDLLTVTLELGMMSARDVVAGLPTLVRDRKAYLEQASLFRFFRYVPGTDADGQDRERTEQWVRAISTLTRYESQIVLAGYDFRRHGRVLDVGGNSGELLRQLCVRFPHLRGMVLDLPLVCDIGRTMTEGHPAADRIRFDSVDVREKPLPTGFDLVVFKSMLHDWDASVAQRLVEKAFACLEPGGRVLVVEKHPVDFRHSDEWHGSLMWFPYYAWRRGPQRYVQMLERAGFESIGVRDDLPRELAVVWGERGRR